MSSEPISPLRIRFRSAKIGDISRIGGIVPDVSISEGGFVEGVESHIDSVMRALHRTGAGFENRERSGRRLSQKGPFATRI